MSTQRPGKTSEFSGVTTRPQDLEVDLLFVPVFQSDDELTDLAGLDAASAGEIGRARAAGEFRGKAYESFISPIREGYRARRIALVGAGERAEWDAERMKRVAAACGHVARVCRVESLGFVVRDSTQPLRVAQAAAESGVDSAGDGAADEWRLGALERPGGDGASR